MKKKNDENEPVVTGKVEQREITQELREAYLDYAMSVIVSRALPDVRDGLKPVQRRILWAMWDAGITAGTKPRKSAYITGETMGKFHPHGDMAIYDALARMAQDFSLRYPLINGQGNWGSIDGDSPAAQPLAPSRNARTEYRPAGRSLGAFNKASKFPIATILSQELSTRALASS